MPHESAPSENAAGIEMIGLIFYMRAFGRRTLCGDKAFDPIIDPERMLLCPDGGRVR